MEHTIATLVLTRPGPAARRVASEVRGIGWPGAILFSPVLKIVPIGGAAPPDGTLVFTSENGVLATALRGPLHGRSAVAVGDRTACAANRMGARCRSAGGDLRDLVAMLCELGGGPYIHCRGRHVAGDLVSPLGAVGIEAKEVEVYDQVPIALTEAAKRALVAPLPTVLPLYSPRSARIAGETIAAAPIATKVVALSEQVAAAWPWSGRVCIAPRPEAVAIIDMLRGLVGWDGGR